MAVGENFRPRHIYGYRQVHFLYEALFDGNHAILNDNLLIYICSNYR
jgi:hypothetical protein